MIDRCPSLALRVHRCFLVMRGVWRAGWCKYSSKSERAVMKGSRFWGVCLEGRRESGGRGL